MKKVRVAELVGLNRGARLEGRNLVLLGPPRVGKTHLAIALGVRTAELGYRVSFITAMDLARKTSDAPFRGLL